MRFRSKSVPCNGLPPKQADGTAESALGPIQTPRPAPIVAELAVALTPKRSRRPIKTRCFSESRCYKRLPLRAIFGPNALTALAPMTHVSELLALSYQDLLNHVRNRRTFDNICLQLHRRHLLLK